GEEYFPESPKSRSLRWPRFVNAARHIVTYPSIRNRQGHSTKWICHKTRGCDVCMANSKLGQNPLPCSLAPMRKCTMVFFSWFISSPPFCGSFDPEVCVL